MMKKQPFDKIIDGEIKLQMPEYEIGYVQTRHDFLVRNDNLQPWRDSLAGVKSIDDVWRKTEQELAAIQNMEAAIYGIWSDGAYIGEVYAKDIDYVLYTVFNLGYAVDTKFRGNGVAPKAIRTLESDLWKRGVLKIYLFCHPSNAASLRVAGKCHYKPDHMERLVCDIPPNIGKVKAAMFTKHAPVRHK